MKTKKKMREKKLIVLSKKEMQSINGGYSVVYFYDSNGKIQVRIIE